MSRQPNSIFPFSSYHPAFANFPSQLSEEHRLWGLERNCSRVYLQPSSLSTACLTGGFHLLKRDVAFCWSVWVTQAKKWESKWGFLSLYALLGKSSLPVALLTVLLLKGAIIVWLQWPFTNGCEISLATPFPQHIQFYCSVPAHSTALFLFQHQGTLALKLNKEHLTSRLLTARCATFSLVQAKKTYGNTTSDFIILWYLFIFA